jgi:hypothetical protein
LSYPGDWTRLTNVPEFPGLKLSRAIGVAPTPTLGAGVVVGMSAATGEALLSHDLLSRLDRAPPRNDQVFLGPLAFYRYASLRVRGFDRRLTLFVAPTTAGVLTAACYFDPPAAPMFAASCERVAHALRLTHPSSYLGLGPSRRYEKALNAVIGRLNTARVRTRQLVRDSAPARRLTVAAASLSHAFSQAADVLRGTRVSPADAGANKGLLAAADEARDAYAQIAMADGRHDPVAHASVLARVARAEHRLRRARLVLARLGYAVR